MDVQNKVFVLAYSDYEEYIPYLFIGSELNSEDSFKRLCDSLVDIAATNAIKKQESDEYPGWVGWHDIVQEMIPLLIIEGYIHFDPKIKVYNGSGIIQSTSEAKVLGHDATEKVIRYNKSMEDRSY